MAKARNDCIDVAKGLGIILVVIGHVMSPVMSGNSILEWLYSVIYTFHMPLFFFVSGYVAKKLVTKPVAKTELIKQRLLRLMVPYCVWAVIYLPMKIILAEHVRFSDEYKWYSFFLGNNPDGQLWFLYVLFVISIFMIFFVTSKNISALTILFMIGSILAPLIPFSIGFTSITLTFSLHQVGFFFLGTLTAVKVDYNKVTTNITAFIISAVVLVSYSVVLWIRKEEVWFLQAMVALCAIYVCLFISALIAKTKVKAPFIYLGKKSMEIYLLHGPLLVIGRILLPVIIHNTYLYLLVLSLISIVISLVISFVINKIKIARLLLFGSK